MADEKVVTLQHYWDAADVSSDPPVIYKILPGRRVSSAQLNWMGQMPYEDLQALHTWVQYYGASKLLVPGDRLHPAEQQEPETVVIGSKVAYRFPHDEYKMVLFEDRVIRPKVSLVLKWSSPSTDIYNYDVVWQAEVSIYDENEVPFETSALYTAVGSDSSTANATNSTEIYLGDLSNDMGKILAVKLWREIGSSDDTLDNYADLHGVEIR
jgi:hypothetical protein